MTSLSEQDVRRVAAEAMVDARTVSKFLEGGEVRPLVKERIEAAMRKLKLKK